MKTDKKDLEARPRDHWFNPWRCASTPAMQDVVRRLQRAVEAFETSPHAPLTLRRKRARVDIKGRPDATNFTLLLESLVCDLVRHSLRNDGTSFLVSRSRGKLGSISRYAPPYLGKALPHILDCLASPELGYIEQTLGSRVKGNLKGETTVLKPTARLQNLTAGIGFADFAIRPGEEIIVLRGTSGQNEPREWVEYEETSDTQMLRREMQRINEFLESADIEFIEGEGEVYDTTARRMRRYFTHGSFRTGGRLYHGYWQQIPRDERNHRFLLQGERVVTLDYAQMALSIAYSIAGEELPPGDGYAFDRLAKHRGTIKKLINSMLFPRPSHWSTKVPAKLLRKLPFPYKQEDTFLDLVMERHGALRELFWTDVGHVIQRVESDIIVHCLLQCIDRDIVALQVHDALIVPESREAEVREIMIETFKRHTGLEGSVETE